DRATSSVHLCDYPETVTSIVDKDLSERMQLAREISSLGRSARMNAKLKVRQPLAKVEVILAEPKHQAWLESHAALIMEELNVKQVEFAENAETYIDYQVQPNFKRLGPRVGKAMPTVKKILSTADGGELLAQLNSDGRIELDVDGTKLELDAEDVQVQLQAKEGWAAAQGRGVVVVLSTEIDERLLREGFARDLVRGIQDQRKQHQCEYTDRIQVGIEADDELIQAFDENKEYIQQETLAVDIQFEPIRGVEAVEVKIGDQTVKLWIGVISTKENR
ncbi:MAG: hypothetical protein KDA60_12080, partial [Planctomycetales bacterium]|nr:hypothetical protein [Planctomycetales bacterium]